MTHLEIDNICRYMTIFVEISHLGLLVLDVKCITPGLRAWSWEGKTIAIVSLPSLTISITFFFLSIDEIDEINYICRRHLSSINNCQYSCHLLMKFTISVGDIYRRSIFNSRQFEMRKDEKKNLVHVWGDEICGLSCDISPIIVDKLTIYVENLAI